MSSQILEWLKTDYERTHDTNDNIKFTDLYDSFKYSDYYSNLSKAMKRKYNKHFFYDELRKCIFLRKNIKKTAKIYTLIGWKKLEGSDGNKDEEFDPLEVIRV
jgi:hypothetical protein